MYWKIFYFHVCRRFTGLSLNSLKNYVNFSAKPENLNFYFHHLPYLLAQIFFQILHKELSWSFWVEMFDGEILPFPGIIVALYVLYFDKRPICPIKVLFF